MGNGKWGSQRANRPEDAPEPKFIIMSVKIFRSADYKTAIDYENAVNAVIREIQMRRMPVNLTSLQGEIHVMYGSEVQQ